MLGNVRPEDEYPHSLSRHPGAEESVCYSFFDTSARLGAIARIQTLPAEGLTNAFLCCFMPDGGLVGMRAVRLPHTGEDFQAQALKVDVVRPFEEVDLTFEGLADMCDSPPVASHPRSAPPAPGQLESAVPLQLAITYSALTPIVGSAAFGGGDTPAGGYEQLVSAVGQVKVGDHVWFVDANGIRDHRWSARSMVGAPARRWLTGNFGPAFGFSASVFATAHAGRREGFVWDGTSLHRLEHLDVETNWSGSPAHPDSIELQLFASGQMWTLSGKMIHVMPTAIDPGTSRQVMGGLARWSLSDGRVGYGLVEYDDIASTRRAAQSVSL